MLQNKNFSRLTPTLIFRLTFYTFGSILINKTPFIHITFGIFLFWFTATFIYTIFFDKRLEIQKENE